MAGLVFAYTQDSSRESYVRYPLFGNATTINQGAVVIRGATAGTNTGYGIVGVPTYTNVLGVTMAQFAAATTDNDPTVGSKYLKTPIICNPTAVFQAPYDTVTSTNGLTIASMSATPGNPTVTSLEAVDGGWLLGSDGFLSYIDSISAGAATLKTAAPWTAGTQKVAKIFPLGHLLVDLTTTADALKITAAAAGTGKITVLYNTFSANGFDNVQLDPTKHSGLTLTNPVVTAYIMFQSHCYL